jgi:3-oxoacyl-[acyl-carrier protein] reductase
MDLKLQGKRALVTGASRGLGHAVALGLAREGARISLNSRDPDRLGTAAQAITAQTGVDVFPIAGDVAEAASTEQIVEAAAAALGGLDLLVTNAGGPPAGRFESFDDTAWGKAVDLSFLSHVRLIRAALPHLRRSTAASVLTITSFSVRQPIPNLVFSNSVRAATVGLTKSLALELGPEGIRFNSILPAWTETERVVDLMTARARANNTTVEEEILLQSKESVFNRMSTPEEFANAAVFLLSPAASYITGVMLTVDGGMYKGTF